MTIYEVLSLINNIFQVQHFRQNFKNGHWFPKSITFRISLESATLMVFMVCKYYMVGPSAVNSNFRLVNFFK